MEWFIALLVPLLLIFITYKLLYNVDNPLYFLIPIIISFITVGITKYILVHSIASDVEYLSMYPIKTMYHEEWDEEVSCIHSYDCYCDEDKDGNKINCQTCYEHDYDVDYHPEYWDLYTNTNSNFEISENYYHQLVKLWGNEQFEDMERYYHSIDGDIYYSLFDNEFDHIEPMTLKHTYINKTQLNTMYKFRSLDKIELTKVLNYPHIKKFRQENCIGCTRKENLYLERYNAFIGKNKQIKIFIIKFGKDFTLSELQKIYWKNGNKNELVICVGDDWVNTFSWMDDKTLEIKSNDLFNTDTTMLAKIKMLDPLINKHWKRKEFSDFDYIKVPLLTKHYVIILIVSSIMAILSLIILNKTMDKYEKENYHVYSNNINFLPNLLLFW